MGEYMRTAVITWVISNLHMAKALYPALIREGPGVTLVLQLVKGGEAFPVLFMPTIKYIGCLPVY